MVFALNQSNLTGVGLSGRVTTQFTGPNCGFLIWGELLDRCTSCRLIKVSNLGKFSVNHSFTKHSEKNLFLKIVSGEYELESEQIESLGGQECSRQPVYTTEVIGTCGQDNSGKPCLGYNQKLH